MSIMHEAEASFEQNADGLYVARSQVIPSQFMDNLTNHRNASANVASGEYERVASVPTSVWELWIRQGRDPINATAKQIVQWLKADGLDYFLTSERGV